MGNTISLDNAWFIDIRPNFQTVATLIIKDVNKEIEVNAPFEFKDPESLFTALEKATGVKIVK